MYTLHRTDLWNYLPDLLLFDSTLVLIMQLRIELIWSQFLANFCVSLSFLIIFLPYLQFSYIHNFSLSQGPKKEKKKNFKSIPTLSTFSFHTSTILLRYPKVRKRRKTSDLVPPCPTNCQKAHAQNSCLKSWMFFRFPLYSILYIYHSTFTDNLPLF